MSKVKATKVVYHPTIAGVTREVEEADSGSWKDAGWRLTDPGAKTTSTTSKAADSK